MNRSVRTLPECESSRDPKPASGRQGDLPGPPPPCRARVPPCFHGGKDGDVPRRSPRGTSHTNSSRRNRSGGPRSRQPPLREWSCPCPRRFAFFQTKRSPAPSDPAPEAGDRSRTLPDRLRCHFAIRARPPLRWHDWQPASSGAAHGTGGTAGRTRCNVAVNSPPAQPPIAKAVRRGTLATTSDVASRRPASAATLARGRRQGKRLAQYPARLGGG